MKYKIIIMIIITIMIILIITFIKLVLKGSESFWKWNILEILFKMIRIWHKDNIMNWLLNFK